MRPAEGLRQLHLVLLTFERPAVVRSSGCLMAVSVSSSSYADRLLPLRSSHPSRQSRLKTNCEPRLSPTECLRDPKAEVRSGDGSEPEPARHRLLVRHS